MIPQFDFASELNVYPLVATSIFQVIDGQKAEAVANYFEKAKGILDKSQRLDAEMKGQLITMIDEIVASAVNQSEELVD